MAVSSTVPPKLPVRYYTAIGELVAAWAHFEFNVERLIWALLGLKHREGRLLTTGMQARPKFSLLRSIGPRYAPSPEISDAIENVCKEAEPLADIRNNVVHGVWTHPTGKKRLLHLMKVTGNVQNRMEPVRIRFTDRKIAKYARTIRTLTADVRWILVGLYWTEPTTSRKTPSRLSAAGHRVPRGRRGQSTMQPPTVPPSRQRQASRK